MRVDADGLVPRLVAFLEAVEGLIPGLNGAPWHLAFPAGRATLIGSELGRQVWDSDEGRELLRYLLTDETLRDWFSLPPDSAPIELQFVLASAVDQWTASREPAHAFAAAHAAEILDTMRHPNPVCTGVALAHGVTVNSQVALPYGLAVAPATSEQLQSLTARMALPPNDVMRLPRGPVAFLISSTAASRAEWGAMAAAAAFGFAAIALERLRTAIWFATGVLPGKGDTFLWHDSPYPAGPLEHTRPLPEQQLPRPGGQGQLTTVDGSLLWHVVARLGVVWGNSEGTLDDETMLALWVAQTFLSPALEWADPLMTLLLSYAAMDGLLLARDDDDMRLGPRVAWLVAANDKEHKTIRRLVSDLRELRGDVAHGRRPHLMRLSSVLGQPITEDELSTRSPFVKIELQSLLRQRCLGLLRRVLLGFLWLSIEAQTDPLAPTPPVLQAGLTRQEILNLLGSAAKNDTDAQEFLSQRVPNAARGDAP